MLRFSLADSSLRPAVGESCLRQQYRLASCQACLEACQVGALAITLHGVVLDPQTCTGCGNCLFVCPVDAIGPLTPPQRAIGDRRLIAPLSLLAPTLNELLLWHAQYAIRGVEMVLDEHLPWAMAIAKLNLTLRKLQQPLWQIFPPVSRGVDRERRHLLAMDRQQADRASVTLCGLSTAYADHSMFRLQLDTAHCVWCGACSRVCTQQALTLKSGAFSISANACNGCTACRAVCPVDALSVTADIHPAGRVEYALSSSHCADCGRPFLSLEAQATRCPICLQHEHGMR